MTPVNAHDNADCLSDTTNDVIVKRTTKKGNKIDVLSINVLNDFIT